MRAKVKIIESLVLVLGVMLLPVYVFSSGGVQPTHALLAIFGLITISNRGFIINSWVAFLIATSMYVFLVEAFYAVIDGRLGPLINGAFFFYNSIIAMAIYLYCRRVGLSDLTWGGLLACGIALISLGLTGISLQEGIGGRSTGTFNNPNQLGYFSVCILSLTYLLYYHRNINYLFAVGMFSAAVFLSIASLSKAAMIANFVVVLFALKPAETDRIRDYSSVRMAGPLFWGASICVGIFLLFFAYTSGLLDDYAFVRRLQRMSEESDSSLESRGYFAFLQASTAQIFFGLGSTNVLRIVGHEVHSTLANMLNNYGLVGFGLFSGALILWARNLWRAYGFIGMCCLTGPAMLYGLTHNGTRFTIFWVLFGASMAMAHSINGNANRPRPVIMSSNIHEVATPPSK